MNRSFYIILLGLLSYTAQAQICVGDQGKISWEIWKDLPSGIFAELLVKNDYPKTPFQTMSLFKTQSPYNFDNFMGAKMYGFISVPITDDIQFNITGNDKTQFYLSSDDDPSNLQLLAFTEDKTGITEHNKYPTQTTGIVNLTAGNFYYFEILYVDGNGHDHCQLYWRTQNEDPDNWVIISTNFISDAGCKDDPCPKIGTPCNDGNAATTNDMEDGHCNCLGTPNTSNNCIGERGEITVYAFDDIPGAKLIDLYNHPNYPGMPNRSFELDEMGTPYETLVDSTGHLIQGYLTVPVDGIYKFNLTANNSAIFSLSSDDSEANYQATQVYTDFSTGPIDHDDFTVQTSGDVNLLAGEYYYFELQHKEFATGEHFSVFWQTPFTEAGQWKRIPDIYFYDYTCEIACIPVGNPCDDGDPFTNNDVYDANCQCAGTPCSGPDCNDLTASYVPFPKCDETNQLDNREENNWLSCEISNNPHPGLPDSHWVKYDLGKVYNLYQSHIWNYNVAGELHRGFQTVQISYRKYGGWKNFGTFTWPLADGTGNYEGFSGPDFDGLEAQHILITSLDDPSGNQCRGFGKFIVDAVHCLNLGESCDDGEALTINDAYDEDCECVGEYYAENACDQDTTQLLDTLLVSDVYSAIKLVESANLIESNGLVVYIAGEAIDLIPGFEVNSDTNFDAYIEDCDNLFITVDEDQKRREEKAKFENTVPEKLLSIIEIPDTDEQIIQFYVEKPGKFQIQIKDQSSTLEFEVADHNFDRKGYYHKRIRTKKLDCGIHQVVFTGKGVYAMEKMVVL